MLNQSSPTETQEQLKAVFDRLDDQSWQLVMEDPGSTDWREHWNIDGNKCKITNTTDGMVFQAGPEAGDNAHHGVLWTKESFHGDMKVEFDFTRLDTVNRGVCILYFHANGIGEGDYVRDIHAWAHLRQVPWMKTYFEHMDLLHLSFAAFGNEDDGADDYLRVRRYPVRPDRDFSQIEVEGTVYNTGLFETGVTTHITLIKTRDELVLHIKGVDRELYHCWDISTVEPTENGPFGIRQMWRKESRYQNIKIYTRGA